MRNSFTFHHKLTVLNKSMSTKGRLYKKEQGNRKIRAILKGVQEGFLLGVGPAFLINFVLFFKWF